jgi:hypothetical protein
MAPGALDAIGLVVQSVPVDPSHVRLNLARSNLGIEITAEGAPGQIYEIESSTDLENWVYVSTLINELGSVTADLNSSGRQTFYRLLIR